MNLERRGLEIGPVDLFGLTINPTFHWYGLIIVLGILAAANLVAWMAKRDGKDPNHVWNGVIWVVVPGVIAARLWHVLFPSISTVAAGRTTEWYLSHPFDLNEGMFVIWSGGLSIFGAVIGGALGILLYAYRQRLDKLAWLDMAAVSLPLGQAIGRWANYVNEELYGKPTDLPWGIRVSDPPAEYAADTRFHPLFLYESLWNLLVTGVLLMVWLRWRDRLKQGDILLFYLIAYPAARFVLEFLRIEVAMSGGINVSQAFSAAVAVTALGVLVWRYRAELRHKLAGSRTPDRSKQAGKRSRQA